MKTVIYTAEITEIADDSEYEEGMQMRNGKPDELAIADTIEEMLGVDDVVVTKVQVFEDVD